MRLSGQCRSAVNHSPSHQVALPTHQRCTVVATGSKIDAVSVFLAFTIIVWSQNVRHTFLKDAHTHKKEVCV